MKKIAVFGWADIEKGASQGGGYNLVAQQHLLALSKLNFDTFYLQSGTFYSLSYLFGAARKPSIHFNRKWKGISSYKLLNSSNRAPALFNMNNRISQLHDNYQNNLVANWLKKHDIKSVFIHSLEGQALDLPSYLSERGFEVQIFCHDHFYICPQVNLLYKGVGVCVDYNKGIKCEKCSPFGDCPKFERNKAADRGLLKSLKKLIKLIYRKKDNKIPPKISPIPTNEDLISNLINVYSESFYSRRREIAIANLNSVKTVFAPSLFLKNILELCGVSQKKISYIRIGLPHLDELKSLSPKTYTKSETIRFCFRGSDMFHKGMEFLFSAIMKIPDSLKGKCKFIIYGVKKNNPVPLEIKSNNSVILLPPYSIKGLASQIADYDIGILPHLWYENSPLALFEHLASGKPVLCSNIGGVVDFITEGENGWFFKAGDIGSFIEALEKIMKNKTIDNLKVLKNVPSFESFIAKL